jgi:hypothetical protein
MHAKIMPKFEPSLFVKWGSGPGEATPLFEDLASGGLQARLPNRKQAAALPFRLDAQGGFHLFSPGDGAILAFDSRGSFDASTRLDTAGVGAAVDFAVGAERVYILFRGRPRGVILISVNRAGVVQWRREDLDRAMDRVVLTARGLFVGARLKPERLIEIDPVTGAIVAQRDLAHAVIRPFAAPDGTLVSATYFAETRRRGVLIIDTETGRETAAVAEKELYGPLTRAFGTDAAHDLYLYGSAPGELSSSLLVVAPDAQVRKSVPFDALLSPGPGRPVVVARFSGSELHLTGLDGGSTTMHVELPEPLRARLPERLALIEVDAERAVFDLRDEVGFSAERMALRFETGAIEPMTMMGGSAVVPGMQPLETWQVGADGRVYVPVISEQGVTVVRIDLSC